MTLLTFDELWSRLNSGDESCEIEAKRSEEIGSSIHETISAFSNEPGRGGGYILMGVIRATESLFPDYKIVGVRHPDKLQRDLATQCREVFNIAVRPQITVEQHNRKTVVIAYIPEAQPHEKPVYIKSKGLPRGAFRRIGSTDQHCTEDDVALFYQLRDHRSYDETAITETTTDDFDKQAIKEYRRVRAEVNPGASELRLSDRELLYALAATTGERNRPYATIAGLLLFGKASALRRHFPMMRVDYIRVEGREWVPDPARRYQAIEMREPLITLIPRVINQVLSDVPKTFSLSEDSIYRKDVPLIPRAVIREAVVNALMHRNYRLRQPVQIIRYANRIEIRNPGHSLVPDDRLGEPGSLTRNEKIAAVIHEANLAETKGTGIRTMREAMARANLTAPLFESDRERDSFTVTLLVHHLLSAEDVEWLAQFKDCNLNDDEAKALIVFREMGAINNAVYRDINRVDALNASGHLRRLRDLGLLEPRGKGSATYYIPARRFLAAMQTSSSLIRMPNPTDETLPVGLNPTDKALPVGFPGLPAHLSEAVANLGQRATPDEVTYVILKLCRWRALQVSELAVILNRSQRYIQETYLRALVRSGDLQYTYPDNPAHPHQAYKTASKGKRSKR
jgi:ATP-dependent DNA helicase RecG